MTAHGDAGNPKGSTLGASLEEALAAALRSIALPPSRAAELRSRILARARAEGRPPGGLVTVRADEGAWIPVLPQVERKVLFEDSAAGTRSVLLRLGSGATIPPHSHGVHEECVVLQGALRIGSLRLRRGDYHVAPAGIPHDVITSESGALLFLREASAQEG